MTIDMGSAAFAAPLQTRLQANDDSPSARDVAATNSASTVISSTNMSSTAASIVHSSSLSSSSSAARRLWLALLLLSLFTSALACGPGRGIGGPRKNRKLTPLVFKQHVPNMSEKNLGASGLDEGPIRRDSPKFKDLVPNYNKDIIFKDEEGTGADRLMTQRCKEKLNTLAVSVMNQWPGVRLRVTESWDEDKLHGADSLHYEGRAVDITTSDRDRTKYGMLARLAVEAGFDWVYYESRAHIHCSVKSDASQASHVSGCFTSNSTVLTSTGERKTMSDLALGDSVLTMTEDGESRFSEVILFMDRQLDLVQDFVEIRSEGGATLTLTPAHLVMLWNPNEARTEYRFADHVEEGDLVFVSSSSSFSDLDDDSTSLRPERVVGLRTVRQRGVVAPLTREGTIVVNSVAASCYAVVNSQSLAHWSLMPVRLMATLKAWLPHGRPSSTNEATMSSSSTSSTSRSEATQQNGVHWYAKALYKLKDFVVPLSWRYQ